MALGYNGMLYILAFDHRGSFRKMLGITGAPTEEDVAKVGDAKRLIFEGMQQALADGAPADKVGVLVDEQAGADVARDAKAAGIKLAMPVEASGQPVFDFEYGDDFGAHIEAFDPDFSKVLVRWNPDDDPADKSLQGERLARLGEWLHANDRKYLFELLVPASDAQMELVGGDAKAYDTEIRPYVTLQAIEEIQAAGIEPDIWKIEGLDRAKSCELLSGLVRRDGRDGVVAVVLGRGADDSAVDHWLRQGAGVDGYAGFAIGRSIFRAGVEGIRDGTMQRSAAIADVAANYRRFVDVYEKAS
jgi:myo-inositol catabolism protein IolC